jgi:hypothetical protein
MNTCGQSQNLQTKILVAHDYVFSFKWEVKDVDNESDFISLNCTQDMEATKYHEGDNVFGCREVQEFLIVHTW